MWNIAHLIIKRQAYTVDSSGLLHVYDINRTKMNTLLANIQCTELSRQIKDIIIHTTNCKCRG